jgi:L-threonylcarbamoyladenylate synthase
MKIEKIENLNIKEVIEVINNGGLIIFPTETSYGVGVDATNEAAVTKLLTYKKRPEGKAISIAVADQNTAENFVELNGTALGFYKNFLPGPVTIISKSKHKTDLRLESEMGTLGIRIPNYKLILDILKQLNKPLTATSANVSGGKTPYSVEDILENIPQKNKDLIDLIIDAGELPKNPPSTVIDTTTNDLTILRSGRINPLKTELLEEIETNSEDKTIEAGKTLIQKYHNKTKPFMVLLSGELGAGKTHFTKGIAQALGINQVIKSPTYNYVNEYAFDGAKLFHMDAWKIQSLQDLQSLEFYKWQTGNNVIVIEWPSVVMNLDEKFFENTQYIYIEINYKSESNRVIKIFKVN